MNTPQRSSASDVAGLPEALEHAVQAARDKKAMELVVLDLRPLSSFTDFFVICSGNNPKQVQAIAEAVEERLKGRGVRPAHVEGFDRAEWILLDYFDFIVHVFSTVRREFYALERLWGSAEQLEVREVPEG
jgi:ribosome-associated protein